MCVTNATATCTLPLFHQLLSVVNPRPTAAAATGAVTAGALVATLSQAGEFVIPTINLLQTICLFWWIDIYFFPLYTRESPLTRPRELADFYLLRPSYLIPLPCRLT